jgi:hypothetical protein
MQATLPPVLIYACLHSMTRTNFNAFFQFVYIHTKFVSEIGSGWIEAENMTPRLQEAGRAKYQLNTYTHASLEKKKVSISQVLSERKGWPFINKDGDIL